MTVRAGAAASNQSIGRKNLNPFNTLSSAPFPVKAAAKRSTFSAGQPIKISWVSVRRWEDAQPTRENKGQLMDWVSPFIVYRITPEAKLEEVFHAADMKKAKYWLTYIAQPGDVLCRTPIHPKHSGQSKTAEYWCHKAQSGTSSSKEQDWKEFAVSRNYTASFPEEQLCAPRS